MKNLFVLMALAGLAAFQVGCGGDSATPVKTAPTTGPGMGGPGAGPAAGMPAMTGEAKKDGEDKKDDAATEGDKPEGDAAAEGDKKDE
jgi:hypothetical protein